MEKLRLNQVYSGTVESYSSEGLGIVRCDGAVVFVPCAVRGERIKFRIQKVMKTAYIGEIVKILDASSHRVEPDCAHYLQCGGCVFRHMDYGEECWAKCQRVQDALTRLGGADVEVSEILAAEHPLHYRNKCQYPVSADGVIGFYKARTHEVVPITDCAVCDDAANRTAAAVQSWMTRYKVSGYDEKTGKGLLRHVYVRVNHAGESLCCVLVNGRKLPREPELAAMILQAVPQTVGVVLGINTKRTNVILGDRYRTIWGKDTIMDTLCGLEFQLSVPSFYQINREQAEVLYQKAIEYAGLTGRETVVDLYCGAGTITLCMAGQAKQVIGAEIVPEAIRDANENAKRNGVENVSFFCGDAKEIAAKLAAEQLHPDVITVDPPRKGLAPQVIEAVGQMAPQRVVYVSCDPATLGRDVKRFAEQGYTVDKAAAVDLFPGTRHVETIIMMTKCGSEDKK